MNEERTDLQKMITQALEEIKETERETNDLDKVNLALVSRKTVLSRSRLRMIKENGFIVPEHRLKGKTRAPGKHREDIRRSSSTVGFCSIALTKAECMKLFL